MLQKIAAQCGQNKISTNLTIAICVRTRKPQQSKIISIETRFNQTSQKIFTHSKFA